MREKEEKAIFSEEGDKDDGEEKRKALPLILVFLFSTVSATLLFRTW